MVARDPGVGAGGGGAAVPRRVGRHREPRRALRRERPERPHRLDRRHVGHADRGAGTLRGDALRERRGAARHRPPPRGARISRRSSASSTSELRAMKASTRASGVSAGRGGPAPRPRARRREREAPAARARAARGGGDARRHRAAPGRSRARSTARSAPVQNDLGVEVMRDRQRLNTSLSRVADGSRGTCETACIDAHRGNGHGGGRAGGRADRRGRRGGAAAPRNSAIRSARWSACSRAPSSMA